MLSRALSELRTAQRSYRLLLTGAASHSRRPGLFSESKLGSLCSPLASVALPSFVCVAAVSLQSSAWPVIALHLIYINQVGEVKGVDYLTVLQALGKLCGAEPIAVACILESVDCLALHAGGLTSCMRSLAGMRMQTARWGSCRQG